MLSFPFAALDLVQIIYVFFLQNIMYIFFSCNTIGVMRIFILACLILTECIAERVGNADVSFND